MEKLKKSRVFNEARGGMERMLSLQLWLRDLFTEEAFAAQSIRKDLLVLILALRDDYFVDLIIKRGGAYVAALRLSVCAEIAGYHSTYVVEPPERYLLPVLYD